VLVLLKQIAFSEGFDKALLTVVFGGDGLHIGSVLLVC
jgi:hypothetical protein